MKELNELEQLLTPKATFRASDTLKERIMDAAKASPPSAVPLRVNKRRTWYYAAASVALLITLGAVLFSLEVNKVEEGEPLVAQVAHPSENDEADTNTALMVAEPIAPIPADATESTASDAAESIRSARANHKPCASVPIVAETPVEPMQVAKADALPTQEKDAEELPGDELDFLLAQLRAESMARVQQCDMECFNEKIMVRAQRLELIVDEEIKKETAVSI